MFYFVSLWEKFTHNKKKTPTFFHFFSQPCSCANMTSTWLQLVD